MPTSRPNPSRAARRSAIAAAAICLALIASCKESAPAGPIFPLLPSDAIAAAVVESPYALYAEFEKLWASSGLSATIGGSPSELFAKGVPDSEAALSELDFARPWAFALLPDPGASEPRMALYIPLRGQSEDFLKGLGGEKMKLVAKAKGYAVLASGSGELAFPPARALDLSGLARYPAASVKAWCDPAAIREAATDRFEPIAAEARRFVTGEEAPVDAAAEILKTTLLGALSEIEAVDAALTPGPEGLVLRCGLSAKPAGALSEALARAGAEASAADWAAQVDSGALCGYAWSGDPSLSADLYEKAVGPLMASAGLPAEAASSLSRLQRRWSAATGRRGAASFDLGLDLSVMADLKGDDPAAIAAAIKRLFSYRLEMVQEVADEGAYRELMLGMADDPDFSAFFKAYEEKLGLSVSLAGGQGKEGDLEYGELRLGLKASDPAKLGLGEGGAEAGTIFDAMADLFSYRWAVSRGRLAMTSGGPAELRELAARDAAPRPLSAEPSFASFSRLLPAGTVMIGSFSLRRAFELAAQLGSAPDAPEALKALAADASRYGSWYSYASINSASRASGGARLELGTAIPAGDLGALAALAVSLGAKK